MKFVVIVKVHKSEQQLPHDDSNLSFDQRTRLEQISTAAARAKFHDDPQLSVMQKGAVVFGHMLGGHAREDLDLSDNVLDLIFGVLDVDDLDGNGLVRLEVSPAEQVSHRSQNECQAVDLPFPHFAETAAADELLLPIPRRRIRPRRLRTAASTRHDGRRPYNERTATVCDSVKMNKKTAALTANSPVLGEEE